MKTGRMEAFSDGVIAILITIMVLELRAPEGTSWEALGDRWPILLTYVLSFVYLGIYWNNHHNLLQATERVSGLALWANLHLLFWLSLVPFTTAWMGENDFATIPTAVYGIDLLAAGIAFAGLLLAILREQGRSSLVAQATGANWKGKLSPVVYAVGIALTFVNHWLGFAVYVGVAVLWFVPDRRYERALRDGEA